MDPELDAIDAKIVSLLHADGRMTNTEAARRLGLGEATVRKRVARLLERGVIQFQAWVDPLKVGYDIYAIIQIQVSPAQIEAVAETLGKLPEVAFLGVCTGDFDIFAAAVFRSNADLYDFLTRRLSEIPGISRTSTSSMIRLVKREYAFPIPATAMALPEAPSKPAAGLPRPRRHRSPRGRHPAEAEAASPGTRVERPPAATPARARGLARSSRAAVKGATP